MILWVVGEYQGLTEDSEVAWELHGIYDDEFVAAAKCIGWDWFIGPIELNAPLPEVTMDWEGMYYPAQVGLE